MAAASHTMTQSPDPQPMFEFDPPLDRSGTFSVKHDLLEDRFGRADLLPLWVADMDLASPPCVQQALQERARHGAYGYTYADPAVFAAIIDWQWRQHGWRVEREWITLVPNVITGMALAIQALSDSGDGIALQPPVYHPFFELIQRNRRLLLRNPLRWEGGRWQMDLDALAAQLKAHPQARLLLLCNPHNPGGSVWREAELVALGELCERHDLLILSDEIHADLVYPPHRHLPLASLSPELAARTLTFNSPGKSFNIPGLNLGYVITPNPLLRSPLRAALDALGYEGPNLFGLVALKAAYGEGGPWLAALRDYLHGNLSAACASIAAVEPRLQVQPPEATYLLWLDARRWMQQAGWDDAALARHFVERGLALSPGIQYGAEGSGFMRLNAALPRARLLAALAGLDLGTRTPA